MKTKGMTGRKHSEETKKKIRQKLLNRIVTPEARAKISVSMKQQWTNGTRNMEQTFLALEKAIEAHRGKPNYKIRGSNHPLWRGGTRTLREQIMGSLKYKEWRHAVFERDNYTCQECKKTNCYLQADHIQPFYLYPELWFELSNGRTLCKECHQRKTSTDMKNMRSMEGRMFPLEIPEEHLPAVAPRDNK